jgi:hypothetical protein
MTKRVTEESQSTLIVTMLAGFAMMVAFLFGWQRRRSQQY